jgi:hypothetical protein
MDATLDQEDTPIYIKTRSDIEVSSVMDDQHLSTSARSASNLTIHASGDAYLKIVRKIEGYKTRAEWHQAETLIVPFSTSSDGFQRSEEDICSEELSQNSGAWSSKQLEPCVYRLMLCDRAECQHDLVQLIVRL